MKLEAKISGDNVKEEKTFYLWSLNEYDRYKYQLKCSFQNWDVVAVNSTFEVTVQCWDVNLGQNK